MDFTTLNTIAIFYQTIYLDKIELDFDFHILNHFFEYLSLKFISLDLIILFLAIKISYNIMKQVPY